MNNRKLSTVETLPVELLRKIYFYCLNVNFPRASPYLAAGLSSESVYRLSILLAYWDNDTYDDSQYIVKFVFGGNPARYEILGAYPHSGKSLYNVPQILRPLGHDYVPLSSQERGLLQCDILQCRWCTHDRIRRQFPDLIRLIVIRWCVNAGYMLEEDNRGRKLEDFLQVGEMGSFLTTARRKQSQPKREKGKKRTYPSCQVDVNIDIEAGQIPVLHDDRDAPHSSSINIEVPHSQRKGGFFFSPPRKHPRRPQGTCSAIVH